MYLISIGGIVPYSIVTNEITDSNKSAISYGVTMEYYRYLSNLKDMCNKWIFIMCKYIQI